MKDLVPVKKEEKVLLNIRYGVEIGETYLYTTDFEVWGAVAMPDDRPLLRKVFDLICFRKYEPKRVWVTLGVSKAPFS